MTQDEYDQRLYDAIAKNPGATFDQLYFDHLYHEMEPEYYLWEALDRMEARHQIVGYWQYPINATAENLDKQPKTRHYRVEEGERPGGEK